MPSWASSVPTFRATDAPGCRETVVEGVNGYLVPPRNPEVLAQRMEMFIENPETVSVMGAESRRLAEQKFNVEGVTKTILETMELL